MMVTSHSNDNDRLIEEATTTTTMMTSTTFFSFFLLQLFCDFTVEHAFICWKINKQYLTVALKLISVATIFSIPPPVSSLLYPGMQESLSSVYVEGFVRLG